MRFFRWGVATEMRMLISPDFERADAMYHGDVFDAPFLADFLAHFPHLGFSHLGVGLVFQPQGPPSVRVVPHGTGEGDHRPVVRLEGPFEEGIRLYIFARNLVHALESASLWRISAAPAHRRNARQFVSICQHGLPVGVFAVHGQHHASFVTRQGGIGIDKLHKGLAHGGPRREIYRNRRRAYRVLASCETFGR